MVSKKPKIVIIGAGMAGLTAANKLYTCPTSKDKFELCVVEGGSRIGGRINTSEFGGDRIEMGATWIHGIGGSPIHKIAEEIDALDSDQPWECMDSLEDTKTFAEGGFEVDPSLVDSISTVFKNLMDFAQGKKSIEDNNSSSNTQQAAAVPSSNGCAGGGKLSVGSFLRRGLHAYWGSVKQFSDEQVKNCGNWSRKLLEEAIFAMHENIQRTYTSAGDLFTLDFDAESEYIMFPGEEITIAKGYLSIIHYLASVLPSSLIHLDRKVRTIEWQPEAASENGGGGPVKIHFCDGSVMSADHVIVTVSLGVLKAGIKQDCSDSAGMLFKPPLPSFKTEAITRLGFGVVNKLFFQLSPPNSTSDKNNDFPLLQMAFQPKKELRVENIPWWIRKTASISPIYKNSSVLLTWFAGKEALELESLSEEEIINGVSTTLSSFIPQQQPHKQNSNYSHDHHQLCNGNNYKKNNCNNYAVGGSNAASGATKVTKVLRSKWGNDPLFLGSYSYVAFGSSGDDLDTLAEPLPKTSHECGCDGGGGGGHGGSPPLQIMFAGEATHRTHYSTTHGAYFSGLREANRLLQHYRCIGI